MSCGIEPLNPRQGADSLFVVIPNPQGPSFHINSISTTKDRMYVAGPESVPATMNSRFRFVLPSVIAAILLLLVLSRHSQVDDPEGNDTFNDKIIVMAKLEEDNTDWVTNDLAEYVTIDCIFPLSESYYN